MATIPGKSDRIEAVFRRGVRYEPAWKHYGTDTTVVTCDRCGASALQVCIGLDDTDLCIKCFDELKERTEQLEKVKADVAAVDRIMREVSELTVTRMLPSGYAFEDLAINEADLAAAAVAFKRKQPRRCMIQ